MKKQIFLTTATLFLMHCANAQELVSAKDWKPIQAENKSNPIQLCDKKANVQNKPSNEAIKTFIEKNINNPKTIYDAAQYYNLNTGDLSNALGIGQEKVTTYFTQAGLPPLKPSNEAIKAFIEKNIKNPKLIYQAAEFYKLNKNDISIAINYTPEEVESYFEKANLKLTNLPNEKINQKNEKQIGSIYQKEYYPIVGINNQKINFKQLQNPNNLQNANFGYSYKVKVLDYETFNNTQDPHQNKMKFFLPPGTIAFSENLYYFLASEESKGVMKLYTPPNTELHSISLTTPNINITDERLLNQLINGNEVFFANSGGIGGGNSMLVSSPNNPINPLEKGGWVYSNFKYPGDQLQRGLFKIYVKEDCYQQWYMSASTEWDSNGNPKENVDHSCSCN